MRKCPVSMLEFWAEVDSAADIASQTRLHLSSPPGLLLATQLSDHLRAYNATDDLIPYFGDYRLAHTEAFYQLRNSVGLSYYGFYSQAFATLRSVCELSLFQASFPQGEAVSDQTLDLLRSMLPSDRTPPGREEVNWALPLGFGATQSPKCEANSLAEWAVDGCGTPPWKNMQKRLLNMEIVRQFDSEVGLSKRMDDLFRDLNHYVHARGFLRSATGISGGNMLRFSMSSLSQFGVCMVKATQISVVVLLLAFLPTATSHPDAAAGFINKSDLRRALSILPSKDAELLQAIYEGRDG